CCAPEAMRRLSRSAHANHLHVLAHAHPDAVSERTGHTEVTIPLNSVSPSTWLSGVDMRASSDDARFWDRAARKYARDPIKDMIGYERTLDRTVQLLRASDVVLELGCGTGTTALKLAPHVARIVAADVSQEMIAIAQE